MIKQIILTALITAVISVAVTGTVTYVKTKRNAYNDKLEKVAEGMLSCLRADIIGYHDKFTDRGYCPIYAKDAVEKAYQAYHALGGNGTITKLYKELMDLPNEPKG